MTNLDELAARVEAATGPDRELDMLVWAALNGYTDVHDTDNRRVEATDPDGAPALMGWIDPGQHSRNFTAYGGDPAYPFFTASLDAAMTLVPEGCVWWMPFPNDARISDADGHTLNPLPQRCSTPALALTAAALRAKGAGQ